MKILMATIALVFITGCATGGKTAGLLYTSTKHGEAVSANEAGKRAGKACQKSILGLISTGDSSIELARRKGRIKKITSVDAEVFNILGLYGTYCTIVRGM